MPAAVMLRQRQAAPHAASQQAPVQGESQAGAGCAANTSLASHHGLVRRGRAIVHGRARLDKLGGGAVCLCGAGRRGGEAG